MQSSVRQPLALAGVGVAMMLASAWSFDSLPGTHQVVGVVRGVVFDSLLDAPLQGADVQLLQSGAPARTYDTRTDSTGAFVVEGVSPGSYAVGFFHPRLDSLGVDLPPLNIAVVDGAPTVVELATPSRETIVTAYCPANAVREGTTLYVGYVRDAQSGNTLGGANISVSWTELALREGGLNSVREGGIVAAGADGRFAVCNVPVDADLVVRAAFGADTTAPVSLNFPEFGILGRDLFLASGSGGGGGSSVSRFSSLTGRVRSPLGNPVIGARVSVLGSSGEVRSLEGGEFMVPSVLGGSTTIEVRAVGYDPYRRSIDIRTGPGRENVIDVHLSRSATTLAPVTVVDRANSRLLRSGFDQRRRSAAGRFLDEADLERMRVDRTTSALAQMPGMTTRTASRGTRLFMRDPTGRACSPTVWVDGTPYSPAAEADVDGAVDIDMLADPSRIAGIEIYRRASQAPLQFGGTMRTACGVIVIWRKES